MVLVSPGHSVIHKKALALLAAFTELSVDVQELDPDLPIPAWVLAKLAELSIELESLRWQMQRQA